MRRNAFFYKNEEEKLYEVTYFLNPNRWQSVLRDETNPILNENNWADEIKYLNENQEISDEIKELPRDKGGIYMFYVKAPTLSFIEKYILYVGRVRPTEKYSIRERAKSYYSDSREAIKYMFRKWSDHLFYRYYPDTDEDSIVKNEILLINAILPPLNEDIPNNVEVQEPVNAF